MAGTREPTTRRNKTGSKRGNNEGSIRQRANGRWEARYTAPDGSQKSLYAATRAEASRRLAETLRDLHRGLPPPPERLPFGRYLADWLDARRSNLELSTWTSYEGFVRLHIVPTLGRVPLAQLTPAHLKRLYANRLDEGQLSPTSVRHLHGVVHKALEDALREGLVQRNVADLVDAPRRARRDMQVYTRAQANKLLDAAASHRLSALYTLALTTGMRQGELLGLRWRDVDLDAGLIQVQQAQKTVRGRRSVGRPKTPGSRRRIRLSLVAVEALRRHRVRQAEERLAYPGEWPEADRVFTTTNGTGIAPSNLRRQVHQRLITQAGIPFIRFHELRHTAATLMLLEGVPVKVVSEMLGHASVQITLTIYAHVIEDMQREAADAMDRLFGGRPPEATQPGKRAEDDA